MKFNRKNRWYIVANRSHAAFYLQGAGEKFKRITRLMNPDARLSESELGSDRPGSMQYGSGHHSYDRKFHRHEQMGIHFAQRIAELLSLADAEKLFDELVLVAGPGFLGFLRQMLPAQIQKKVTDELNREFVYQTDEELLTLILDAVKTRQEKREDSYENRSTG